ncbi:MAG: riboflavin synthase, partial [Dehalococcoidales bacterium]|nr:riboflavin synthase [Dehalococcoidales bacterium]
MFTGIVEEVGVVSSISARSLVVAAGRVLRGIELGGSIGVNGACLTVTRFGSGSFSVDIMLETLNRTSLGLLNIGDRVNLEKPLTLDRPLGGHLVQGHVDATGKLTSIRKTDETTVISIAAPPEVMRYVVDKGFIAVDGISLTISARDDASFEVAIVDHTLKNTTLGDRMMGDLVNLEVDIIAKYIERFSSSQNPELTISFLEEHGFVTG